jgi:hypothetical protein
MKKVILVGRIGAWEADKQDAEVWCVNGAFQIQPNCDRVYAMDRFWPGHADRVRGDAFIEAVNSLKVPIVCQRHYPEVPLSRSFKLREARKAFGFDYYTSTMAYMLAEAIMEKASVIVLHHIVCYGASTEYFPQKACLDFWVGQAMGRGIKIAISDSSMLIKPYPWHTALYGYKQSANEKIAQEILASVMKGVLRLDNSSAWQDPETEKLYGDTQERETATAA